MRPLLLRNPLAAGVPPNAPLDVDTLVLDADLDYSLCAERDLLIVEGGDGTLHRVLTSLLSVLPAQSLPPMAVLPAGTTNVCAANINVSRSYTSAVERLRAVLDSGRPHWIERSALRIDTGSEVMAGFVFGLGVICEATDRFGRIRAHHKLVDGLRMAVVFAQSLLRTRSLLEVRLGQTRIETFAMMATSLDRLLYGMRPYHDWGQPSGLHTTWIAAEATGLWRHLPALFRGSPALFRRPGFYTRDETLLELRFNGLFTVDGDLYRFAGDVLRLSLSPRLRFVVI